MTISNKGAREKYPFIIECFVHEGVDPDIEEGTSWYGSVNRVELEKEAERLICGPRFRLIVLYTGQGHSYVSGPRVGLKKNAAHVDRLDEWIEIDRWDKADYQ